ncbi:MAG TPA: YicC family protein [Rikenellaceae bacterium]|nr:YicC family protein [Rikenellaceae bacterium]
MVQSMTGYGKAECLYNDIKIVVEIRSVNGKGSDVALKTQAIPREREYEVRQIISSALMRGSIDLFATVEYLTENSSRKINKDVFTSYYNQINEMNNSLPKKLSDDALLGIILKMPDVLENNKKSDDTDIWEPLKQCIIDAISGLVEFRKAEGKKLDEEIRSRVAFIIEYLGKVESYESERTESVRQRITSRLEEIKGEIDNNRLEQEIIYYLEKLDITEEKVRLTQHCKYFNETLDKEEYPGKKLGFIAQEIGREINTLGSKANHAEIQRWVVRMKDELEKIKEQSLNIL